MIPLKGIVSRDGGLGKDLEWKIRPKLRFANPFFCLKVGRFKATARRVAYPCKNGLSDPADFAKVQRPI
jgi:hypothetical protein